MDNTFITTSTAHDDCDKCLACARLAERLAKAGGDPVGANATNDERRARGLLHFAHVRRLVPREVIR